MISNFGSTVAAPFTRTWSKNQGSFGYSIYDPQQYAAIHEWNKLVEDNGEVTSQWLKTFHATYDAAIDKSEQLHDTIATVTTATEKQTIQVKAAGQGWVVYGAGIKGAATAVKTFAVSMAPVLIQMAAISLVFTVVSSAIKAFDEKVIHAAEQTREAASAAAEELADVQSEVDSLNDELETTKDRIDELLSKDHLTLTEQDELEKLQQTNDELQTQLALQQALLKEKQRNAAIAAQKAIETYGEKVTVVTGERQAESKTLSPAETLQRYAQRYETYTRQASQVSTDDERGQSAQAGFKAQADAVRESWNEIADALQGHITTMRAAWDTLDAETKAEVEELEQAITQGLLAFGSISKEDALQNTMGGDAFESYNQQLREMAANGEQVGNSLSDTFGEVAATALESLGYTVEDVNEHILALTNASDAFERIATDAEQLKLNEIINDEDFEITSDNIINAFGTAFIDTMDDAGVGIEGLVSWIKNLRAEVESFDISEATSDLTSIEDAIDAIGDAVNEFRDNDGQVSASTLDGLTEDLEAIKQTTEFENFINVLGNANSTTAELNAALDALADRCFDTQFAMSALTEENEELYIAQLKQMGVVNAADVVHVRLAQNILKDANATEEAKEKAYALINALDAEQVELYNTSNAALTSEQNLQILRFQMELVKNKGDFTGTIQNNAAAIVALGVTAGTQAENLVKYANVLLKIADIEAKYKAGTMNEAYAGAALRSLNSYAAQLKNSATSEWNTLTSSVDTNTNLKIAASSSSGSKTTQAEKNKDAYDAAKQKLDYQLEMNKISYDTYYKKLVALGNKYLKQEKDNAEDLRDHYTTLADARRDAFEDSKNDLDSQLENGTITIEKYYSEVEKLMNKWYKGRTSNADDYAQAEIDLQKQISDAWNNRISDQETLFDRLTLEKVWPDGKSELDYWLDQMEDLQKQYRKGMWKDKEAYLKVYYEILEKIRNAEQELAQQQLDEVSDKIEAIDDLVDLTSKMLKQRIEDEIDVLEDLKDTYSEIVDLKRESLDLTREEAEYNKEIAELNEDLTDLQAQAELLKLDTSRAGRAKYADVMSQIREKQDEISEKQSDHTYDATVDALDAADEAYQEFIQNKIDALNEMMENQGEWLRYVYNYIETTKPSQLLSELKAYNYKYGDGINQTVDRIWSKYEQYADSVYGNSGYLVQILDELRNLELKYEAAAEEAENSNSDSTPSDNAASSIKAAVKHAQLTSNTDAQNQALARQVEAEYGGSWWYDPKNQNIYSNDYDNKYLVSAAAYPLITKMKSINSNSSLSKSERKKQLETQLGYLKTYYGYGNAHLVEGTNGKYHLYKTAGKNSKWQIFHEGIGAGYAGSDYVPTTKQNELLALLQKGELIFNKENQSNLLSTLQSIDNFQKAFKGITGSSINQSNYNNNTPVSVGGVTIQIYGNATQDTVQALRREAENISNMTMDKLHSAMQQKGYTSGAVRGTFKR